SPKRSDAEGGSPSWSEMSGVEDVGALDGSTLHGLDVVRAGTVATLASDPRDHLIHLEVISRRGGRCVASETNHHRRLVDPIAQSFLEDLRWLPSVPHRDVEPSDLSVIAHLTLIKKPSVFEHEGLAHAADPMS